MDILRTNQVIHAGYLKLANNPVSLIYHLSHGDFLISLSEDNFICLCFSVAKDAFICYFTIWHVEQLGFTLIQESGCDNSFIYLFLVFLPKCLT